MRTRMSWDWVGDYPVFIFTTFKDHFIFDVRIERGKKGDQNNPERQLLCTYTQRNLQSKDEVVERALKEAHDILGVEPIDWDNLPDVEVPEVCNHCGHVVPGHYDSCTPYYPENPDLSDEERIAHGLLTKAEMEYWENCPDVFDIDDAHCDGAPKLKMIDATPKKKERTVSKKVETLNKEFNF